MAPKIHAGTSGFSYKEWKGAFDPKDLPAKDMLCAGQRLARRLLELAAGA